MKKKTTYFVLALVALLAGASAAQAELGLKGIEGRVGFADLEASVGSTFILSAAADMGMLSPDLGLEFNVDFWTKGSDGFYGSSASWTNIAFLANLSYNFKMEGSFHPYAFAGLGLHYLNYSYDCPLCDDYPDYIEVDTSSSDVEFGFDVGAGAEFGSGNMIPVARAGFNSNGGIDYLFVQGGLKFPMGK